MSKQEKDKTHEHHESLSNELLCADCGVIKMAPEKAIIKYTTSKLGVIYEGLPICQGCAEIRHENIISRAESTAGINADME